MRKPTIHLLGMPHIQVSKKYCRDAYGMKILHFGEMMTKIGYKVIIYASEDNESSAQLETCITKREQSKFGFNGPDDYLKNNFDNREEYWKLFHFRVIEKLKLNLKEGDIIGTFSGLADAPIKNAFPNYIFVELGIGYSGVFADFQIYESWAWLHTNLGRGQNPSTIDGKFYHEVIPNYFDLKDFTLQEKKDDYILFVGRMIRRKGLQIIEEVAKRIPDTKFILAGQGAVQDENGIQGIDIQIKGDNLEYIGPIDIDKRNELMGKARALIVPTLYIGPFEGVSIEAMLTGTPVISTPFGVFSENNIEGVTGYKCHTIKEFTEACNKVRNLNPKRIRKYAERFSMDKIAKKYDTYFKRLGGLARGGFYE